MSIVLSAQSFFQFCWRVMGSLALHGWICVGLVWACLIRALGIGNILWITSLNCLWFCCSWCISERQTRPCLGPVSNRWITWNSSFRNTLCHCWAGFRSSVPVNLNSLHTLLSTLFSMLLLSIETLLPLWFQPFFRQPWPRCLLWLQPVCEHCLKESIRDYRVPHFLPVDQEYFFFCVMFTLREKKHPVVIVSQFLGWGCHLPGLLCVVFETT